MTRMLILTVFATFLLFGTTLAAEEADGETVFKEICATCHATGIAGAPIVGNQDAWEKRIAQGTDSLVKHALNGYQGEHGFMPAKGGQPKLTDGEVKAAVEYMVMKSK